MASVDDRVVAMKFDNAGFQEKVSATIASLDKLKTTLDFTNANKGMKDLSDAGKSFNLQGMADALEHISGKFTAMGGIALGVLTNIGGKAFDVGIQIVKSLSLDQVMSGFHEYETNMNAIQTVLANTQSKGTTLDQVNVALDDLNTYSDKTIYNFSQMAKNIGTFTAAGVDLDTSVGAIKGIANLAALSGSSADQASSGMYQLSQALAGGTVKLMDWNSVQNAGMGGEVFQKALFETGKTLGTLKDVPIDQTFEQWTKAGNTFRGSLEDGWVTSEVLTNTLQGFTGDLTDAQLKSMGYNDAQIAGIQQTAKTASDAATVVKTFSQLISTVKESIGSGWTKSFQIVFGTFDEAKVTFTDFYNSINKVVGASADARNNLLQGWKDLGGRAALIDGIKAAFEGIAAILKPIKTAFREIFPAATAQSLFDFTEKFKELMQAITPSPATTVLLLRAFRGIFSAFSIGIEIVKGLGRFFGELMDRFHDNDPNTGILGFVARIGDGLAKLKTALVDGRGIDIFFHKLAQSVIDLVAVAGPMFDKFKQYVADVIDYFVGGFEGMYTNEGEGIFLFANRVGTALGNIVAWFKDLFSGGSDTAKIDGVGGAFNRLSERFGWLIDVAHALGKVWDWIMSKMDTISGALGKVFHFIADKFQNLPQTIADAFSKTDYSTALDTVNVGLLGGFVLLIKKFVDSNPLKSFDGLVDKVKGMFNGVTDTLGAMQSKLKSEALMNIAKAIALLTVSMVILSLIDSGALTKSLIAMGIGFTELVGVMTALDKIANTSSAAKLTLLATGLMLLSGAILLLSIAMKIMSTMSWEDIVKGMTVTTFLLAGLALAIKPLSDNKGDMIATGIGLIAIAIAMNILALAMKSFAEMSWEEMVKGFAGLAGGLGLIAGALELMPNGANMALQGLGLLEIAVALNIMALALKSFAEMKWGDMLKGFVALGGMLLILAGALELMPNGVMLAMQGEGLILIGIALNLMAKALQTLGGLSWGEIAKGLVAVAGLLLILAIAVAAMEEGIPGAVAMIITAVALRILTEAVKGMASLSWGDMLKGLIGLAAAMAVLAISAMLMEPALGALAGLGIALILVGAGFALFGLGATLIATALSVIVTTIVQNGGAIIDVIELLIQRLPGMIAAIGDGIILLASKILEALPGLIEKLNMVIQALLQLFIDNIPKLMDVFTTFISSLLDVIVTLTPKIVEAGFALLMALLQGISDNIEQITTMVLQIITKFIDALTANIEQLVTAGINFLVAFLKGIGDNLDKVVNSLGDIITSFIGAITTFSTRIVDAGKTFIIKVIEGFGNAVTEIGDAVVQMAVDFSAQCVVWATKLANAGKDFILGVLKAFTTSALEIAAGMFDLVTGFLNGLAEVIRTRAPELRAAGLNLVEAIIEGLTGSSSMAKLKDAAISMAKGILDPFNIFWDSHSPSRRMIGIAENLVTGLAIGLGQTGPLETSSENLAKTINDSFQSALSQIPDALVGMVDFTPTITPVLDLTNVEAGANRLGALIGTGPSLGANVSYNQAALLSASTRAQEDAKQADAVPAGPTNVKFEQNNYSPEALSTADIYRNTRNQIAMAKEALATV